MLAFFGNLAPSEILVLAVIAVLIFGKRLPEVAGRGYTQVRRWRQSLDQLRRETGIDRELRNIGHEVDEAARHARIEDDLNRVRQAEANHAVTNETTGDDGEEEARVEPEGVVERSPEEPSRDPR